MPRSRHGWAIAAMTLVAVVVGGGQGGTRETATIARWLQDARLLTDVQEANIFDFSFPGELVEEVVEQIVVGNVSIYGEFPPDMMKDVVDITLGTVAKTCGWSLKDGVKLPRMFSGQIFQDMATYGQVRIGMNINFWLLPLQGGVTHCAETLAYASVGKPEPPYVKEPKSAFRELIEWEMKMSVISSNWDTSGYYIELTVPTCSTAIVIRSVNHPSIPEENMTDNNTCKTFGEDWLDNLKEESFDYESQLGMCGLATSPCVCAALTDCVWVKKTAVDWRCERKVGGQVSCKACSQQSRCPKNYTQICALEAEPCTCANSYAGCRWDTSDEHCHKKENETESTACFLCPHQAVCDKPQKKTVTPMDTRTLPAKSCSRSKYEYECPGNCLWAEDPSLDTGGLCHDNSKINLTFDRKVRLKRTGPNFRFMYGAIALFCRRGGGMLSQFPIHPDKLSFANDDGNLNGTPGIGNVLQIDVNGTVNAATADCDLLITDYAVEDLRGVKYAGMISYEYTFTLADTAPPRIVAMSPDSGSSGNALDTKLVFAFDENVKPGPFPRATMVSLGGVGGLSSDTADKVVAEIDLTAGGASISAASVVIDLSGRVDFNTLYTIEIHAGAVRDVLFNVFEGLPPKEYTFKTGGVTYMDKETKVEEGVPIWVFYILITAGVAGFCCCILFFCWYRICSFRRKQQYVARDLENKDETSPVKKAWDGSYVQSVTITERDGHIGGPESTWAKGSLNRMVSPASNTSPESHPEDGVRTVSKTTTQRTASKTMTGVSSGVSSEPTRIVGRPLDLQQNKILLVPSGTNSSALGRKGSKQPEGRQNSKPEGRQNSKPEAAWRLQSPDSRQNSKSERQREGRQTSKTETRAAAEARSGK